MLWVAWLPVVIIGIFHYATGSHHHWVHDVLRRLYYVPILFAAFSQGLRGGLAVSVFTSLSYAPHAFFLMHGSGDPGTTLNKLLEILLYNIIGIVAGILADREAGRRRQAEQAYEEQKLMADQLVRAGRLAALGELVAGIAHEIKNPLHTLKGTAEIVDDIVPKDAGQSDMWKLHRQEIGRLERIAERFLSFARPADPKLEEQLFSEVFSRIEELLRAQGHQASEVVVEIRTPSQETLATQLLVDSDQIAQIVLNISGNALKAMDEKGNLSVQAEIIERNNTEYISLNIWNDGPAIPEEDLERVFDPFYTRSSGGTGLGLSVSSRIAQAHRGFIEVENTENPRGLSFSLLLPVLSKASSE